MSSPDLPAQRRLCSGLLAHCHHGRLGPALPPARPSTERFLKQKTIASDACTPSRCIRYLRKLTRWSFYCKRIAQEAQPVPLVVPSPFLIKVMVPAPL